MNRALFRGMFFAALCAVSISLPVACAQGSADSAPTPEDGDPGAPAPPGERSAESVFPGVPGAGVKFLSYPAVRTRSDTKWGSVITDINDHLPLSEDPSGWTFDEEMTTGHESTHAINSDIRNNHNSTGKSANGLYVLQNRAVLIVEPKLLLSDVVPYVPSSLQGDRYHLYLIEQQSGWNDTPTYIFDEWTAYINGGTVCVDQYSHGLWKHEWTDGVMGQLEFVSYAVALSMAVAKKDPTYWASADGQQFKEFVAFNTKRAMDVFRQGRTMDSFKWDKMDAYWEKMKSSSDADAWRAFARDMFGEAWTNSVILGDGTDPGPVPVPDAGPVTPDTGPGPVTPDTGPGPVIDAGPGPSGGDEDLDGIPDATDLCSHTAKNAVVWHDGAWLGCAKGQHRDGGGGGADGDHDGVPDLKDHCTHTPSGKNVWKYGEWMGCARGENRDR